MSLKSIIAVMPMLVIHIAYGQQVEIKIKADRQYSSEDKNIRFTVLVKNKKFPEYFVQDTSYIQRNAPTPAFIWPYIEKKEKGKYISGEFGRRGGASLVPDPCGFNCCNCFLLKKGD